MDVGLIGLPYSGKSLLFKALTSSPAEPPGSVRPSVGVARLPDPRLEVLASRIPTKKITPATIRVVDIPGLVRGSAGKGGGGASLLAHIRDVDALLHVVRCFERGRGGEDVPHVDGVVDPRRDIETVELELVVSDLQQVENALPRAERAARGGDQDASARLAVLMKAHAVLSDGVGARRVKLESPAEERAMRGLGMLSSRPELFVANVAEDDLDGRGALAAEVRSAAGERGAGFVAICAEIEAELADLDEPDRSEMLASLGLREPAISVLAHAAYDLLGLQSFYTAGPTEVRAWTVRRGATAPEGAGAVHSDIQRGFIRAEVYAVDDLKRLDSERAIREAGRMRVEGKHYVLRDGDVCHFLFST
jgi:GTP-binding protein YchF